MQHNRYVMKKTSQQQLVLQMVQDKGIIRPRDLKEKGISRSILSRLVAQNKLEKIDRGLYRKVNAPYSEHESLVRLTYKAPRAVICLLSALEFYSITTELPRNVWIAMPKGSHKPRMDYPPVKMTTYSTKTYRAGIQKKIIDKVEVKIYSLEKTIADCFKYRNKIGIDVAIEALKEAKQKHRILADKLWEYCKICGVTNVIRPYMQAIQ